MPPDNLTDMKCYINGIPLNTEHNEFKVMSIYYKNRKWVAYCDKNNFAIAKKRKLAIKKMDKPNVVYAIMDETQTVKIDCVCKILPIPEKIKIKLTLE